MQENKTLPKLKEKFSESLIQVHSLLDQDTVSITKSALLPIARYLNEDPELQYDYLMDLTAVDYWKRTPRFEMVYHFLSLENLIRIRIKVPVDIHKLEIDSLTRIWSNANWYEREVYDMFGIHFIGHPDLRRILMYPEFEGYPLRKDYPIDKRQPRVGPPEFFVLKD